MRAPTKVRQVIEVLRTSSANAAQGPQRALAPRRRRASFLARSFVQTFRSQLSIPRCPEFAEIGLETFTLDGRDNGKALFTLVCPSAGALGSIMLASYMDKGATSEPTGGVVAERDLVGVTTCANSHSPSWLSAFCQ